jgi:M6 family metalloprotease-like protein
MSFNLFDYGYKKLGPANSVHIGERPLLVVLCTLEGKASVPYATPEEIFGNPGVSKTRNIRDYFSAMSGGLFTFRPAHTDFINVKLGAADSAKNLPERLLPICDAIKAQAAETNFHFENFTTPLSNGVVLYDKLCFLIIDNGDGGQSTFGGPDIVVGDPPPNQHAINSTGVSFVHASNDLALKAHELSHTLGTLDLYGSNWDLNRPSLVGDYPYGTDACHLDPWHKMRLGWIEPKVIALSDRQPHFLIAAGQGAPNGTIMLIDAQKGIYEYFMLEFRNTDPGVAGEYDQQAGGSGLVIWQVKTGTNLEPSIQLNEKKEEEYKAVYYLGQRPSGYTPLTAEVDPNFARGKGDFWPSGEVTPQLTWYDGSPTGVRISVRTFPANAKGIFVDIVDNKCQLPRSAELVSAGPTRMNFAWVDQNLRVTAAIWDSDSGPPGSWRFHKAITEPNGVLKLSEPVLLELPDASREAYWIADNGAILVAGCGPGSLDRDDWTSAVNAAPARSVNAGARFAIVARNPDHRDLFWVHEDGSLRSSWRDSYFNAGQWNQFTLVGADQAWKPASPASMTAVAPHPEMVAVYWGAADGSIKYAIWGAAGGWTVVGHTLMPAGTLKSGGKILAVSRGWRQVDLFWHAPDNALCMLSTPVAQVSPQSPPSVPAGGGLSSPTTLAPGANVHPNGEFAVTAPNPDRLIFVWRNQANTIQERVFDTNHWTAATGVSPSLVMVGRLVGITSRTEGESDLVWLDPKNQVYWAQRNNQAASTVWTGPTIVFGASPAW